jgi:type IX secretion system PorP/SprF family membrane protein
VSYWIFAPGIYNPAIIGSKDFFSMGVITSFQGKSNTQLLSGDTRITKKVPGYFTSPDLKDFTNIGIGASVFHDIDGLSHNTGFSISGAYQIPLNYHKLSFLSFGASFKAEYSTINTDSSRIKNPLRKTYYPNADFGVFYYNPSFYAGVSVVNLLGSPWKPDTLGIYQVPVSREYFLTAGFKILLSKSLNIVLEPSVLVSATDSTFNKISDNINPILKLYLDNFCLGSSYHNNGKILFFAQFRYPSFYVGAFYELAQKTAYFKKEPLIEFTLGLNIQHDKSRFSKNSHW